MTNRTEQEVVTPWGTAHVLLGEIGGRPAVCILRYGSEVTIASHRINYRANIWALRQLGVRYVISQNAIGSLNTDMPPGTVVIPHDFMDFTKSRPLSFFEEEDSWVRMDMTEPFCPELRSYLIKAGTKEGIKLADKGVFICVEGPRFETPSEVRFYRNQGGDIIGTPLVPEVVLAREAGICYVSLSVVINLATGLAPAVKHSGDEGIITYYQKSGLEEAVERMIKATFAMLPEDRSCGCEGALEIGFHGPKPKWLVTEND